MTTLEKCASTKFKQLKGKMLNVLRVSGYAHMLAMEWLINPNHAMKYLQSGECICMTWVFMWQSNLVVLSYSGYHCMKFNGILAIFLFFDHSILAIFSHQEKLYIT